jgi:hypothetical protein
MSYGVFCGWSGIAQYLWAVGAGLLVLLLGFLIGQRSA